MKITISGAPAEGKTAIALLIERALKREGFTVKNEDPDRHVRERQSFQTQIVDALCSRLDITIETVQINQRVNLTIKEG